MPDPLAHGGCFENTSSHQQILMRMIAFAELKHLGSRGLLPSKDEVKVVVPHLASFLVLLSRVKVEVKI